MRYVEFSAEDVENLIAYVAVDTVPTYSRTQEAGCEFGSMSDVKRSILETLNSASRMYAIAVIQAGTVSDKALARAAKLAKATKNLLDAIHDPDNPQLGEVDNLLVAAGLWQIAAEDNPEAVSRDQMVNALRALSSLQRWSDALLRSMQTDRKTLTSQRGRAEEAGKELLANLVDCYQRHWNRYASFSRNVDARGKQEVNGPFLRFLNQTFNKIRGEECTAEGLDSAFDRFINFNPIDVLSREAWLAKTEKNLRAPFS